MSFWKYWLPGATHIVATLSIAPGDQAVFTVDGLGEAVLEVV